jgi:hypothetical protein
MYYPDILLEILRNFITSGIGNKRANHSTTKFYTNVHLFCCAAAAPGALHYLEMPSFNTVYSLRTSAELKLS